MGSVLLDLKAKNLCVRHAEIENVPNGVAMEGFGRDVEEVVRLRLGRRLIREQINKTQKKTDERAFQSRAPDEKAWDKGDGHEAESE